MSWWGTLAGGAFGFMVGGPLGAVLGAAVGNRFDQGLSGNFEQPRGGRRRRAQAMPATCRGATSTVSRRPSSPPSSR